MKKVEKMTTKQYVKFIAEMPEQEKEAKQYCEELGVDFEDVKTYDWGFEWQE